MPFQLHGSFLPTAQADRHRFQWHITACVPRPLTSSSWSGAGRPIHSRGRREHRLRSCDAGMSGARPPTQHAGKPLSLRHPRADASTSCYLDAASVTRLKALELVCRNSNALTQVDAEPSLARFPRLWSGVLRSRPPPDIPASLALGRAFATATVSAVTASDEKTRRWLHRRSPSSIESCIFAHDTVDRRADASVFPRSRTGAARECATERGVIRNR